MTKKDRTENSSGIPTSELGVQTFDAGQHPRTLRKNAVQADEPVLKSAYQEFLKTLPEDNRELLESDPDRAVRAYQGFLAGLSDERMGALMGVRVTPDVADESQVANMGSGVPAADRDAVEEKKNK